MNVHNHKKAAIRFAIKCPHSHSRLVIVFSFVNVSLDMAMRLFSIIVLVLLGAAIPVKSIVRKWNVHLFSVQRAIVHTIS